MNKTITTLEKNTLTLAACVTAFLLFAFILPHQAYAAILSGTLSAGDSGSEVSALQTFLGNDSRIYPEGLVTGFYGPLTVAAVKRYQTQFGIAPVGNVGPITLASINGNSGTGGSDDVHAPFTTSVSASTGTNSAMITWTSNEPIFGSVMYATSWPFVYATAASASGQSGFNTSQTVNVNGLQSHTTYFYTLVSTDIAGNLSYTIGHSFITQ